MFKYSFIANSGNSKTGAMPVTSTSSNSCPNDCALINECYGKMGHTRIHWSKLDKNGIDFNQLMNLINALRKHSPIRFNVVGDLASKHGIIDATKLLKMANTVKNRMLNAIIYTHHDIKNDANLKALKMAFDKGLHVNISCEDTEKANYALDNGLNAVIVLPIGSIEKHEWLNGLHVVRCPAEYKDNIQCVNCMLCARDRVEKRIVIGFTAHGTAKKRLSTKLGLIQNDNF